MNKRVCNISNENFLHVCCYIHMAVGYEYNIVQSGVRIALDLITGKKSINKNMYLRFEIVLILSSII